MRLLSARVLLSLLRSGFFYFMYLSRMLGILWLWSYYGFKLTCVMVFDNGLVDRSKISDSVFRTFPLPLVVQAYLDLYDDPEK